MKRVSSPVQTRFEAASAVALQSQILQVGRTEATPWYVYTSFLATASAVFGLYWDISWHMSIGRDTFWTPAHLMIQFGAVLAGFSCAWLILHTTFGGDEAAKRATVGFWGFRGPLGAFIAAWGGLAMVTSAPFDNWWHNAYGLDVTIISPPHTVLLLGMIGIQVGGLILALGQMNRAEGATQRRLEAVFLATGGLILIQIAMFILEYSVIPLQHNAKFYRAVALAVPIILVGIATAASSRWACSLLAGIYTVFWLAMLWIFPLFPASPKLGPVYQHITHMVPLWFPLLLIAPAIALDVMRGKIAGWGSWHQAILLGSVFLAVFVAVQWPFASFMQTPAARNWVFGANYFEYSIRPESTFVRHLFFPEEATPAEFWGKMGMALVCAIVSTRLGMGWGDWMRRIRR
jgi:hypothetical protein